MKVTAFSKDIKILLNRAWFRSKLTIIQAIAPFRAFEFLVTKVKFSR